MEENELVLLRSEIDEIDKEILALFLRRMEIAKGVAEYKRKIGAPVAQNAREAEIIKKAEAGAGEALAPYSRELFEKLMSLSRRYQQELLRK